MKIKGVIEDLQIFKKVKKRKKKIENKKEKNDRKNISRTFSGGVVGSVGSVHFRIVLWSCLYFSRPIGPFLCSWY